MFLDSHTRDFFNMFEIRDDTSTCQYISGETLLKIQLPSIYICGVRPLILNITKKFLSNEKC